MALTSIPVDRIVKINPSAISAGNKTISLNGAIVTANAYYPVKSYSSADLLATEYGEDSEIYKIALQYFKATTLSPKKPDTIIFVRFNSADTSAKLVGYTLKSKSLDDLKAIKGTLSIEIDGVLNSGSIDLSSATSWSNGAEIISKALSITCTFNSTLQSFIVSSTSTGELSTINYATGDTADALGLSEDSGAVLDNATTADTGKSVVDRIFGYTRNFGGISHDSTIALDTIKLLASYVSSLDHNKWFVSAIEENKALIENSTGTFSEYLTTNNISDVTPIYGDSLVSAGALGYAGSIDFSKSNGITTLEFRSFDGLPASVDKDEEAHALETNGYAYYGAFATATQEFTFMRNCRVTGEFESVVDYLTQLRLNNNLQNSIINGLVNEGRVSYNPLGYHKIRLWCLDPINEMLNFGGIQTNITLSASQIQKINSLSDYADVATELYTKGYVLIIKDASPQVRSQGGSPEIDLFYTTGGTIRNINIASIEVK